MSSQSGSSTSSSLLRRARAHDEDAWRRLVDLYGPLVYHWCQQAELRPEDRADIFQEVFRSIHRHLGTFQRERGSFRGWLLVITKNKIRDQFRRRERQPEAQGGTGAHENLMQLTDPDSDSSLDTSGLHPVSSLMHRALENIRGEFEEHCWLAFWRTTVEDQTSSQAGQELGMSPGAVRKSKARVLARLRRELGDAD